MPNGMEYSINCITLFYSIAKISIQIILYRRPMKDLYIPSGPGIQYFIKIKNCKRNTINLIQPILKATIVNYTNFLNP